MWISSLEFGNEWCVSLFSAMARQSTQIAQTPQVFAGDVTHTSQRLWLGRSEVRCLSLLFRQRQLSQKLLLLFPLALTFAIWHSSTNNSNNKNNNNNNKEKMQQKQHKYWQYFDDCKISLTVKWKLMHLADSLTSVWAWALQATASAGSAPLVVL